jgi:hypothetical protein
MGGNFNQGTRGNTEEYEEDIQPAASLLEENPTGSRAKQRRIQPIHQSATQQPPASIETTEDSVPSLL